MILEEETFEAFGYWPSALTHGSNKPIKAACDDCGKVRKTSKDQYRDLTPSCVQKGNTNALGYTFTEEQSATLSAAMKGKNYKGGKKAADARTHAKRRRQLGYTLLMPLADGEVGHHVTNKYVIGVPVKVHRSFSGHSRKKHRALVLQWLKVNDKGKYKIAIKFIKLRVD